MPKELLYLGDIYDVIPPQSRNYLAVTNCGIQPLKDVTYRVLRKKGRQDFHIVYVESGDCTVYYEGEYRVLHRGEYVIYLPGQMQEYALPPDPPTVTCFVHFHGTAAANALSDSSLTGGFGVTQNKDKAEQLFRKLAHANHPASGMSETRKNGLLLAILSALSPAEGNTDFPEGIRSAVHFLHQNYTKPADIAALARISNLSPSRFHAVFKSNIGVSPHQYLLHLRIERAKEMLVSDKNSVTDVANAVGFEDAFYFSRLFKKHTGMTPLAFRKKQDTE